MAAGVNIDQTTPVWQFIFNAAGGTALPATIWPLATPFFPRRLKAVGSNTAAAAKIIIQQQVKGGNNVDAFVAIASGANVDIVEQNPQGKEGWSGPIVITQFDAGWELEIYI